MRRVALAIVNWLIRVFGLSVIEQARMIGGKDAVERGARWEAFYREENGLRDMIDALRREAFEAAAELDPEDVAKIHYWATADRNLRKLQQRIEAVIVSGKVEADKVTRIERSNLAVIRR